MVRISSNKFEIFFISWYLKDKVNYTKKIDFFNFLKQITVQTEKKNVWTDQ